MAPRDDFSRATIGTLANRVGSLCSNPECRAHTKGPHTAEERVTSVGRACHVHAASPGGPRYSPTQTREERASLANAIWLCATCADLIDSDPERFPPDVLREWKSAAEDEAGERIGKPRSQLGGVSPEMMRALAALGREAAAANAASPGRPVLDKGAAADAVFHLPSMQRFVAEIHRLSDGKVPISIRVEQVPQLHAPRRSRERLWQLAVAESQPTHLVTFYRFVIDVDSGAISFFDPLTGQLVPHAEWDASRG